MHEVRKLANLVRSWTKSHTVFGGAAPWARPDTPGLEAFRLVVAGESDHPNTIKDLLQAPGAIPPYKGVVLKPAITQGDLDWVLPPVRRWDYKYHAYLEDRAGVKHRTTTLFTSRGCPMACAF